MRKITWYLKQLFPLTYCSVYKQTDGKTYISVWKMWFGKVFKHKKYQILDKESV